MRRTQLVPAPTGLVSNFSVPAWLPAPLGIAVVDTCGNAIGNAQVTATFSNGDAPLMLSAANPATGFYSGSWTPLNPSSQVTIMAVVSAPGYTAATVQIPGQVTPGTTPMLMPNGALDVFNSQLGAALAPGDIVQIYGAGLAAQAASAAALPLPTALNGTGVTIGGLNAPLYYVSPGRQRANSV